MFELEKITEDNQDFDYDVNLAILEEHDLSARSHGRLVGRYLTKSVEDGYAYYIITKESKKKVNIELLKGLPGEQVDPEWGEKSSLLKDVAIQMIEARDILDDLM